MVEVHFNLHCNGNKFGLIKAGLNISQNKIRKRLLFLWPLITDFFSQGYAFFTIGGLKSINKTNIFASLSIPAAFA